MTPGRLFDVRVPMADGVSLSTDVVLPGWVQWAAAARHHRPSRLVLRVVPASSR